METLNSKLIFDTEDQIRQKLKILRNGHKSKKLQDISYRKNQLQTLKASLQKYVALIHKSNEIDLGQNDFLSFFSTFSLMIKDIDYILSNIDSWVQPRSVDTPAMFAPAKSYIIPEPFGVCLVMASWNFQYITLIMPLAQAIAAGNCVLCKPSEMAASSALVIEKILSELDPDIVQFVQGEAPQCIELLKNQFDIILFTGSPIKGRIIAEAAAKFLTPCILELGGQNPTIVDNTADLKNAAYNIISGRFMSCGQVCISPEYVLVDSRIHKNFMEILKTVLIQFYTTNPKQSPDYSRIINEFHTKRLIDILENSPKENIIIGGGHDLEEKYIEPTIFDFNSIEEISKTNLAKDELFGPILYVAPYNNLNEVIDYINSKDKPLAIYYFGSNSANKKTIEKQTSSGAFVCNDCVVHFTSEYLPFGGVGKSGYAAYHGKFGFDNLSHMKAVLDRKEMLLPLRYPPFTNGKKKILRFAINNLGFTQSKVVNVLLMIVVLVLGYFIYQILNNRLSVN